MNALEKAARIAVRKCVAVKKGETALVITDEPLRKIGRLLWEACRQSRSYPARPPGRSRPPPWRC